MMGGRMNETEVLGIAMTGFEELLRESVRLHGHLCAGQVLGARMAVLGLREAGIGDPKGADRKNVVVFVETDRCAADAIQSITGCSLGKRTLKFLDYGKMAATFVNLRTGTAVRISARDDSREKAVQYAAGIDDKYAAQIEAYKIMADRELFEVQQVSVDLRPEDMPGRPRRRLRCEGCGEQVQDMRELRGDGKVLCRACATGGYYRPKDISLPCVMQNFHNGLEIRSKVWIEANGEAVFGKGRRLLLEAIDAYGSINRAAAEVGISFRKAWGHIKAMEDRFGVKLVERQAGGRHGGGAVITPEAREFLSRFKHLEQGLREFADERFTKIFGGQDV
jgi:formylmethanofuran dehydrogenase subunit E